MEIIGTMMKEAANISEMSVDFYQTTRHNIQKIIIFILASVGA
jgi:hypothetical protein